MSTKNILLVEDFHKHPYGRGPEDGDGCGQYFRENHLLPALLSHDKVHVDLTGYNRYGRSFLDESFGKLIRNKHFTGAELKDKLSYSHDHVKSIVSLIDERIAAAIRDSDRNG